MRGVVRLLLLALSALNVAKHDFGYYHDDDSPPRPSLRPTPHSTQPASQPTLRRWRRPKRRLSGDDGDDDGGGGDDDGGGDDGGGCTPGWETYECRDDGTLTRGYGCTSCEDCEASEWTAETGGRVTCEPGTSPIVFYWDEDLDGTTDDTWEGEECTHNSCGGGGNDDGGGSNDDGGGGSDDGGGGSDDGGGDDGGGCTPGWETYECRDDGTLTRGYGCTSCEDCEASEWTAETGGRVTCEPGTSPIVFYWDEDLDGTTDDTWEGEECVHNDCVFNDDGGGGSDDGGGGSDDGGGGSDDGGGDDGGGCTPGWETYECRDDGTLTRGYGCTSCEDCEASEWTAETGGRVTCEPGTSPIVFYWDEDLDGTTDDTWEGEECVHNDCVFNDDGGGGSDDGGGGSDDGGGGSDDGGGDDGGGCTPGWETYECRDDGTLTRGYGCTSCEDCEASEWTAETGGRVTCEPGTSPIVFYWDEDLDGTTDDTWEGEECVHNDCVFNDDGGGGSDDGGGGSDDGGGGSDDGGGDDGGGCTPGWETYECRDDGTLTRGYGCTSCEDCEASEWTAETGGRVTCEPGTSPIVFYWDEDLDGTTDDTWEGEECVHNDCVFNDDGGGGSDDGGGGSDDGGGSNDDGGGGSDDGGGGNDDNCVDDLTTTGLYGAECSWYSPSYPCTTYYDDEYFTASLQCCACGGYLGKTLAPTISAAPTAVPSTAVPTTPAPSTPAPSPVPTATPAPTATPCMDDDSTNDLYGYTCSSRYDSSPSDCGCCDDDDFTASEQCCACGGGTPCRSDDSTTDAYGYTCSSLYDSNPLYCDYSIYYDDDDFTASEQCCACGGGGLRPTSSPTATLAPSTPAPSPAPTATPYPTCANDDSTQDSYGNTCSSWYADNTDECGELDDDDFTASEQCCACGGGLAGGTHGPTTSPAPTATPCVNDDSTNDRYGNTCSSWYADNTDECGELDDDDFTASEQCCACGGGLAGGTHGPTTSPAPTATPCVNDDSTQDSYGNTCSSWYADNTDECGELDDDDFTASEQCCACGGGLAGGTHGPTTSPAPTATPCVNDDSTNDRYGDTCSNLYDREPDQCGNNDDDDFTASEQCCACGGGTPCFNDDSTTDAYGNTCSSEYDDYPDICGYHNDDDFTASEQCCACGGGLRPTSSPTATLAPSVNCICNRTLLVAMYTDDRYHQSNYWALTMGDASVNCVDGSASGGTYPNYYSDPATLYTQEITICEDVTYTIDIQCCNNGGYFYLELDGTRFREVNSWSNEPYEFTSLATTFFLKGSLAFEGISYETALANEAVFVAAIAWMCGVEEAAVSVTISQAARRLAKAGRRLDDGGITVAYDVAVEDSGDVMTIIDRVEGYTEAEVDATFILVADDAGVADVFETLVTTESGTPTVTDPYGYSFSYKYTMPPTLSPAPSLSPAPTVSLTEPPSMSPAPTVTFAPTRSPYEYDQPTDDAPPYCRVDDISVCWGNSRRFLRVAGRRPFDTIAWPDDLEWYNPAFGDIDHDGDLDMVVGAWDGKLYFYQNVGSATRPEFVAVEGRKSPFDGIDVGRHAAPVLVDLDGDNDLDLIVGENKGRIFFFNNTGGSAARAEFTPRSDGTGDASMFSDYTALNGDVELDYIPVLADLDNDGDLDIVVGEYKARISYLENIGSASAPAFVWRRGDVDPFDGMAFGDEMNPALADLDGDGDFDLAVGDKEGIIKYYENMGSAERPQFVGRTGSANPFEGVAVDKVCAPRFVDIDGDGDLDLIVGEEKGGLTVYENKASSAVAPVVVEIAGSASPLGFVDVDIHASAEAYSTPTLIDYDGDNDLDVVVGHGMLYDLDGDELPSIAEYEAAASALTFFFYENIGSSVAPAFVQKTGSDPFAFVDAYRGSAATFGDLDQDGDLDLVVGDDHGSILYYENVGSLTAAGDLDMVIGFDGLKYFEYKAEFPRYQEPDGLAWVDEVKNARDWKSGAPALVDLDDDGDLDLVFGENSCLDIKTTATGQFDVVCESFDPDDPSYCAYYDDDDFTASELCCACGGGTGCAVSYFVNNGTVSSPQFVAMTGSSNPFYGLEGLEVGMYSTPSFADVDNDGDFDLVLGGSSGALQYFENNGTAAVPEFIAGGANPFGSVDVHGRSAPALVDYDNDGDLDLAVGGANGTIVYYENTGTAELPEYHVAASPFSLVDAYTNSAPVFGNISGDSDSELFVGGMRYEYWPMEDDDDGGLWLQVGRVFYYDKITESAGSQFVARTGKANPLPPDPRNGPSKPTLGDLDGDGDLDLVIGVNNGAFFYYKNVGNATKPVFVDMLLIHDRAMCEDLASKGGCQSDPDEMANCYGVCRNPFLGLAIDGGGKAAPTLSDFDGDGDLDLVVGAGDGGVYYFVNNGTANSPNFDPVGDGVQNPFDVVNVGSWSAPAVGDIDGDGDADLVVGGKNGKLSLFANSFCTTPCNGRGVCDTAAFFLPACNCLTGFTGKQCDECPPGFFGSTCELCPEGGNETRGAPRITDTCGVAGSGRSRGKCDEGFTGSGSCTCFEEHFSGAGCSKGGCPAGTIESAKKNGLFYEAFCEPCPPGYRGDDDNNCIKCDRNEYSAAGADTCTPCAAGNFSASGAGECSPCDAGTYRGAGDDLCTKCDPNTYSARGAEACIACDPGSFSASGASSCEECPLGSYDPSAHDDQQCVKCPAPSTTVVTGAMACNTCNEGFYFSPFAVPFPLGTARCDNLTALAAQCQDEDDPACFNQCCLKCEKGMNCETPANNTLEALAIVDGWWRDTVYSHQVYPCEYTDSCKAGACTTGHTGVACRVCEAGYHYSSMDGRCVECPGSGKRPNLALVIGVFIFLVVMLGIFLYCYVRRPEMLFVFQVDWRTLFREGFSGLMSRATEEAKSLAKIKGKLNDAVLGGIEGSEDAAVDAVAEEAEEEETAQGGAGKDGAALDDVPDGTEGAPGADTKKKKKTDLFATFGKFQGDFVAKLKTKLKIVLSVYQIQNALPWLLPSVSYPGAFEGLVNGMSFIELDFVRIVPMSCVFPYNFFNKLFGSTMFPLVLAAAILLFGRISSWRHRDKDKKRAAWTGAYSWFLLLTFMVFTCVEINQCVGRTR